MFGPLKSHENSKIYDVIAASPLLAFYGWVLVRDWPTLKMEIGALVHGGLEIGPLVELLGLCLPMGFAGLLILLVLIRTLPIKKSSGIVPRAVALIGYGSGMAILILPPAALPLWLEAVSIAIVLPGLCAVIASFIWLRRSFSILPEARRLVTGGPYAFIRHPVYLFEEITLFGVMLQFMQPWAFLIFVLQLCFQLARIPFEERVLTDAFPQYAEYSARTSRLIPGIY